MGKGDKKSAKGKRSMGSYGITRKRKESKPVVVVEKPKKAKEEAPKKATKKVTKKSEE